MLALLVSVAFADIALPGSRGVHYTVTVDNLAEYPEWVFVAYPTTNSGYGYVFQNDVPITNLMGREETRLIAVRRVDFDRQNPEPHVYPHGDDNQLATVVPEPHASESLRSSLSISPPGPVFGSDPLHSMQRVYHIAALDPQHFDLVLASEVMKDANGAVLGQVGEVVAAPAAAPAAPIAEVVAPPAVEAGPCGCSGASSSGLGALLLATASLAARRRSLGRQAG